MRLTLTGLAFALAISAPAHAQDVWDDAGGIETAWTGEAALVLAPDEDEPALFLVEGGFSANFVFQNGVEAGFRGSAAMQYDHPGRAGFSGLFGPAQPTTGPAGAFSGLARGPGAEDIGARGSIETAYIYVEGGYGEARIGLDQGAAARFFEGAPVLMRHAALANPALDPTGLTLARTDHDLTGPALKVSYSTPRILGVRAGASFTPEADRRGLDRDPDRNLGGAPTPRIENATELALNLSRRLPRSGVRLRAAAAWSTADVGFATPGVYDTVETWSAGGSAEFSSFALGASWLGSDNGFTGGGGDYSALSLGARLTLGKIDAGLEYAHAKDDGISAESDAWGLTFARKINDSLRIAGGWQTRDTTYTRNPAPLPPRTGDKTDGIVIEITLSR
jgi:hypothetical protein